MVPLSETRTEAVPFLCVPDLRFFCCCLQTHDCFASSSLDFTFAFLFDAPTFFSSARGGSFFLSSSSFGRGLDPGVGIGGFGKKGGGILRSQSRSARGGGRRDFRRGRRQGGGGPSCVVSPARKRTGGNGGGKEGDGDPAGRMGKKKEEEEEERKEKGYILTSAEEEAQEGDLLL